MTERSARSEQIRQSVAAATEAVLDARGDVPRLRRNFEHSHVPMVMVNAGRRFVEVNHPARLWFRLSREEMRKFLVGDLMPASPHGGREQAWSRLLDAGCGAGRYPVYASDGSRLDVVYRGVARILPGLHLIAFAPADWPRHGFDAIPDDRADGSAALTPRELEVLALAADGLSGPDLARELFISQATVRTHLTHIYAKLGVGNRAAAVAKAMRLGQIA
jgi:DNA-binding CsgD family transcriptional regulator